MGLAQVGVQEGGGDEEEEGRAAREEGGWNELVCKGNCRINEYASKKALTENELLRLLPAGIVYISVSTMQLVSREIWH